MLKSFFPGPLKVSVRKNVGLVTPQPCKIINISKHILGQRLLQLSLFSDGHDGPCLSPQQD